MSNEATNFPAQTAASFWNSTAERTVERLGAKDALKIDRVHTENWIDIANWLADEYEVELLENDIMMLYFIRFYSELLWLQIFFLTGNYLELYRSLRYNLESIAQAYHIHEQLKGESLDLQDHIGSLITEIEEENQTGRQLIEPALNDVLKEDEGVIESWFFGDDGQYGLWDKLCKSVHPSGIDIVNRLSRNPNMLYWNEFEKSEAEDAISATDAVFDVITVTVLKTYPKVQKRAEQSSEFPRSEDLFYTNRRLNRSNRD